jgi:hypothetical protein
LRAFNLDEAAKKTIEEEGESEREGEREEVERKLFI